MHLLAAAVGLAFAGLDVFGFLILAAERAVGASKRAVVGFTLAYLVAAAGLGTTLALLAGPGINGMLKRGAHLFASVPGGLWVAIDVVVSLVMFGWAIMRHHNATRPAPMDTEDREQARANRLSERIKSPLLLTLVGIPYGLSAVIDPSFLALVVLASRHHHLPMIILANLVWATISQAPLFLVTISALAGVDAKAIAWLNKVRADHTGVVSTIATAAITAFGVGFLADAVVFLIWRVWLF
jgi:hypothetical protein